VGKLREAGFPPDVLRRVVMALVSERFDARRLEIERDLLATPFWKQAQNSYGDPKVGAALMALQREQVETVKKLLGGTVGDALAGSEEDRALLRLQIGDIPPEKIDQLYATVMDFNKQRQQVQAARGNGPMLAADQEKMTAIDKALREDLTKFLTPAEANEFVLRQSTAAGQLRSLLTPARPTEAEYRALFPIYQDYSDRFPWGATAGESPDTTAARRAAEEQMLAQVTSIVGADRAADFKQAGNRDDYQINQLVARLDLPISAATQATAVRTDIQSRMSALRDDASLDSAARLGQLTQLQAEANTRLSKILGGQRGVDAYKQYGGQWLTNMVPRSPPKQ
jgi:hypothetical protein